MVVVQENNTVVTVENGGGRFFDSPSQRPSNLMKTLDVCNTITHFLLGAVSIGAIAMANVFGKGPLASHIYLCVIGYIIMMSQGILSLSPNTGWSRGLSHDSKKHIHWLMQVMGATLAIAGSIVAIVNTEKHFESVHGSFGLVAFMLTLLSLIGGLLHLFTSRSGTRLALTRLIHAGAGATTIIMAYLTLIMAYNDYYRLIYNNNVTNMYIAFTSFALLSILSSACVNMIKNLK